MLNPATDINVDTQLLDILICPVTGAALQHLTASELVDINKRIEAGSARHADGTAVDARLDAGLITVDGRTIYRVDDDIPVMLPECGIVCD